MTVLSQAAPEEHRISEPVFLFQRLAKLSQYQKVSGDLFDHRLFTAPAPRFVKLDGPRDRNWTAQSGSGFEEISKSWRRSNSEVKPTPNTDKHSQRSAWHVPLQVGCQLVDGISRFTSLIEEKSSQTIRVELSRQLLVVQKYLASMSERAETYKLSKVTNNSSFTPFHV